MRQHTHADKVRDGLQGGKKGCKGMKGWKKGVTVGGKGVEGTVAQGKNGNNKQTTIICFISLPFPPHLVLCVHRVISELRASMPTPLLPCLHVVAAAVFTACWSLTSLYVYDTACRVTNQLSFHPFCWSNDLTNFAAFFFFLLKCVFAHCH